MNSLKGRIEIKKANPSGVDMGSDYCVKCKKNTGTFLQSGNSYYCVKCQNKKR